MRQSFFAIALLLALSLFTAPPVKSQPPVTGQEAATPQPAAASQERYVTTVFDEKKYVDPTYPNLAHLYWALGILDINRNKLVDNFIAITECTMYKSYVNNDIEWKEIREATREYLRTNYKSFPTHFKITIPLYLGRYDAEEQYFEVDQDKSAINSVRNIETIYNTKASPCGTSGDIDGYPRNLILYLNRPFLLAELPVEKELARLFLDEVSEKISSRAGSNNRPVANSESLRMAYLQLMFRVHSYKQSHYTTGGYLKAVVFAQIDYIRVFADFAGEKLLYQKDMYEEENRKRRRRVGPITGDDLKLPDGPIFGDTQTEKK